jgi:hypothetical protein
MARVEERDPAEVITAILKHVPAGYTSLRTRLEKVRDDAAFCAPEYMRPIWLALMNVCRDEMHVPPRLSWEKKIADIVEGRAEE